MIMNLNLDTLVWPGKNQPVFASHGVVATSQPLAAQAGLSILRGGGNAVDAAIAAAAVLTVVEPACTSLGGDAFALVWDGNRLHGLNGSGRSPAHLEATTVHKLGLESIPEHGWLPVTIPGVPAAWRDLHHRFGRLPFARVLESAVSYAEDGYPVSPISVWHWRWQVEQVHTRLTGAEFAGFGELFAPDGHPPRVGDIWRNRDMATSLRSIAETNGRDLYTGNIADRIVAFAKATGGFITADDLASHSSTWVDPINTTYRGYNVWEMPPNGQGLAALLALNILEGFDLRRWDRNTPESFHLQIEAMKLAFADAQRFIGDPDHVAVPTRELLSKDYAASRRQLITREAGVPEAGEPLGSETVYLCTADAAGMMVSFIQSSFDGFGSHVVVPGTGIVLQNRGSAFSLDPAHPNILAPSKRPYHTIIPGFLTKDGSAIGPFGVMGGHMQPQGHVQMIVNTLDYDMDPQTSLDQPRWSWWKQKRTIHEPTVNGTVLDGLRRRGHDVQIEEELDVVGRGQIIWRLPSGAYVAGSDHRADGQAAGY